MCPRPRGLRIDGFPSKMGPRTGSISAKTLLGVAYSVSSPLCPKKDIEILSAIRNW